MEPPENSAAPPKGMPIYSDTQVRLIVDSLDETTNTQDWYPSNAMAIKLWQCLEALRDIDIALENVALQKNATKKRRQLKQFSVQLHSLAMSIVRLCDQIVGDEDARRWLKSGTTAEISKIKSEFFDLVPISHKGELSVFRNQLGGHIDAKLSPWSAQEILSRKAITNFGQWLHICIHALLDLLKLDVYAWGVHATNPKHIRLMTNEPFLITFEDDGKTKRIVALHLSKRSPRQVLVDIIDSIIKGSQWMFNETEPRIRGLKVDDSNAWNSFTGSRSIWYPPESKG